MLKLFHQLIVPYYIQFRHTRYNSAREDVWIAFVERPGLAPNVRELELHPGVGVLTPGCQRFLRHEFLGKNGDQSPISEARKYLRKALSMMRFVVQLTLIGRLEEDILLKEIFAVVNECSADGHMTLRGLTD